MDDNKSHDEKFKKDYSGKYSQRIECNVTNCTHNCLDDSTCRLDKIQVSPFRTHGNRTPEEETACSSYFFVGDLNEREDVGKK